MRIPSILYRCPPGQTYDIIVGTSSANENGLPSEFKFNGSVLVKVDGGKKGEIPQGGAGGNATNNIPAGIGFSGGNGSNGQGSGTGGGSGGGAAGPEGNGGNGGNFVAGPGQTPGGNGGEGSKDGVANGQDYGGGGTGRRGNDTKDSSQLLI